MAKKKETNPDKPKLTDKDHPSLIEVGGQIRLRVLEDFYIEQELPKWKHFKQEWARVRKDLGIDYYATEDEVKRAVERLKDKSEEEKAEMLKLAKSLLAMDKAVRDDRWRIREKHEKEVDAAVMKQARFVRELTWRDRLRNAVFGRKVLPVNIAMDELMAHLELTSTPELTARLVRLREMEDKMRAAGQYNRADTVKSLRAIMAEESTVCAAGFTSYITEQTMIDFLRKSERGTSVDFLRYYEDEIPEEAMEKKIAADKLMVFDNYVVAHYSDVIQRAANAGKKADAEKEKRERVKRRDPILFGVIKNSRKLYYICDWVTDTDDLTLEKLEKELGITRGSLVDGASTQTSMNSSDPVAVNESSATATLRREIERALDRRELLAEYSDITYADNRARYVVSGSTNSTSPMTMPR